MNSVFLIGRLTNNPDLRYTQSGKAVTNIRLAVDSGVTNQHGEKETDFIDVSCWERQAEAVANYLQKGRLVAVRGRLRMRQYTTRDGQRRERAEVEAHEVRFLDRGDSRPARSPDSMGAEVQPDDEDVPF